MARDRPPAIDRRFSDDDLEPTVRAKPYSNVNFTPGMGDAGRRVEIVEHDCPFDHCSHDRMIRLHHVNPESGDTVRYWCLSPNCPHFVGETLSWACHGGNI